MSDSRLNKDKFYAPGIILIVIGYLISLNPYWWIFGTPLIYLTGMIFIYLSKKKKITKILLTVSPIVLWVPGVILLSYFTSEHMSPETFLIPKNFRGKIVLYYGEPCGLTLSKIDGRYIYHIPMNGIMIIKNKFETGIIDENYFFIDSKGKSISKIPLFIQQDFNEEYTTDKNKHEPPRKQVAVFLGASGGTNSGNGETGYKFHELYVDSWDSLRANDDKKTDSISLQMLNNCRIKKSN